MEAADVSSSVEPRQPVFSKPALPAIVLPATKSSVVASPGRGRLLGLNLEHGLVSPATDDADDEKVATTTTSNTSPAAATAVDEAFANVTPRSEDDQNRGGGGACESRHDVDAFVDDRVVEERVVAETRNEVVHPMATASRPPLVPRAADTTDLEPEGIAAPNSISTPTTPTSQVTAHHSSPAKPPPPSPIQDALPSRKHPSPAGPPSHTGRTVADLGFIRPPPEDLVVSDGDMPSSDEASGSLSSAQQSDGKDDDMPRIGDNYAEDVAPRLEHSSDHRVAADPQQNENSRPAISGFSKDEGDSESSREPEQPFQNLTLPHEEFEERGGPGSSSLPLHSVSERHQTTSERQPSTEELDFVHPPPSSSSQVSTAFSVPSSHSHTSAYPLEQAEQGVSSDERQLAAGNGTTFEQAPLDASKGPPTQRILDVWAAFFRNVSARPISAHVGTLQRTVFGAILSKDLGQLQELLMKHPEAAHVLDEDALTPFHVVRVARAWCSVQ